MRLTFVVMLALVPVVVQGSGAEAQAPSRLPSAHDPFAVPQGPVLCHLRAGTPADSAASLVDMIDGSSAGHPRSFMFAFDSAGGPRYGIITNGDLSDSTRQIEESIAMRLAGKVGGMRIRGVNGAVDTTVVGERMPGAPPGPVLLTPDELSRAAVLARWVWGRRCSTDRARPSSSSAAAPTLPRS